MFSNRGGGAVDSRSVFLLIFGMFLSVSSVAGTADSNGNVSYTEKGDLIDDEMQVYLMRYGYLSPLRDGVAALRTEESLRDAISNMQRFAHIPITGKLDERTKKLLHSPRCGVPDIDINSTTVGRRKKRYTLHKGKPWSHTDLTWSLVTRDAPNVNLYEARQIFARALDLWAQHSKLTFTEVNSDKADIAISFVRGDHGDNFHFDGRGYVLAHAFFPGTGRGGDAHFDMDEIWLTRDSDSEADGTSLFKVASHEFGHSLGLSHSDVEGALMAPFYQAFSVQDYQLPEDDKNAIQALYGVKDQGKWGKIPNFNLPTTKYTTPRTTTTTTRPTPRYPHHRHEAYPTWRPVYTTKYPSYPTYGSTKKPYYHTTRYSRKPIFTTKYNTNTPKTRFSDKNSWDYPKTKPRFDVDRKQHKESSKPSRRTDKPENIKPDMCNTSFDAASIIRGEVFFFKNKYFWRIGDKGLHEDYPFLIARMFNSLPEDFTHIDAVYERPDNKIVIFIGKYFYVYSMTDRIRLEPGSPKPLTDLGLPPRLKRLDGATVWGHNGKTFFFSGHEYWRFDDDQMKVELDYPRSIKHIWKGIPNGIDAVLQWKDGKTYFFKGKSFWKFDDLRMSVEQDDPKLIGAFWMGCTHNLENTAEKEPYTAPHDVSFSSKSTIINVTILILTIAFSQSVV